MSRDSLEFKAESAKHLLDNPILMGIFDSMEREILHQLEQDQLLDYADSNIRRDRLVISLQQLGRIRTHLKRIVNAGKVSNLDELAS